MTQAVLPVEELMLNLDKLSNQELNYLLNRLKPFSIPADEVDMVDLYRKNLDNKLTRREKVHIIYNLLKTVRDKRAINELKMSRQITDHVLSSWKKYAD